MKQEEVIEKAIALYEKHKTPALVILKTPLTGGSVDNGLGVDFDLPEYAVIYDDSKEGERSMLDRNYERYELEKNGFPDFFEFGSGSCKPSFDSLIQEMADRDKYEVVWRRAKK